jgi:glucose-1-phosphate cytidylyltransferase
MLIPSKVPVFILAGGLGTRLSEETSARPKPMVEIGGIPILIHIMRWYYSFGFNDFVICAGYLSWDIKQYFLDYEYRLNHIELDHRSHSEKPAGVFGRNRAQEQWRVRVLDTGLTSLTGARIARALDEIGEHGLEQDHFALTYGDGLTDLDLLESLKFHSAHGKVGTLTGVKNVARFGELDVAGDSVEGFLEKPEERQGFINGGFFFFHKSFRKYLSTDPDCILERTPLSKLASDNQLKIRKHSGFWAAMDTLRDKHELQKLWNSGKAPWASAHSHGNNLDL